MKIQSVVLMVLLLSACGQPAQQSQSAPNKQEDKEAKALLQGIWVDEETEELAFRASGDTIFYPDSTSQPAFFCIIDDSLELSGRRYAIEKQAAHVFWFRNANGDIIKLSKSDDPQHRLDFEQQKPKVLTYTEVVNRDSVVFYEGERYHWYVTINPTKYKVVATTYNDDGMEVKNVYYDNIIHLSLFQGARRLYSSDFRKQMYGKMIPGSFLNQAILSNIEYGHVDAQGFHFSATLCKTDGVSCYMVDIIISKTGAMTMKLLEY